jgi:hypothetical protein
VTSSPTRLILIVVIVAMIATAMMIVAVDPRSQAPKLSVWSVGT